MICEKCWADAYRRSRSSGKPQYEEYKKFLEERKDNPCPIEIGEPSRDFEEELSTSEVEIIMKQGLMTPEEADKQPIKGEKTAKRKLKHACRRCCEPIEKDQKFYHWGSGKWRRPIHSGC